MSAKIYAPNVHLFAFHLKDNNSPNLLWDKCNNLLSQKFGITKPLEIEEKPGYRVDLLKDKTDDDVGFHFQSQVFLNGNSLSIAGVATPLRIHDTYVLSLNLRRPEFDDNQKKTNPLNPDFLALLNPSGCLMPREIGSSLGQTILLTIWYTSDKQWLPWKSPQNRQKLREIADNCLRNFIPNQYSCPEFYREGELFGSPIFEYGVPTQAKDYGHILIWIFCAADTSDKFIEHYSSFVNLFCYLNKVVAAFKRSRQVSNVIHQNYQDLEPYINKIFQGLPVNQTLTKSELNQFKEYLRDLPQKYLSYSQFIGELDRYRLNIETNAQNYKREINDIQSQLPGENLSFISNFIDRDYHLFIEQIQSDLAYFQHGIGLLEKAMTAIQGRVDIEQAESDRAAESKAQKRQERLELFIAFANTGLAVSGISSQVANEPAKTILTQLFPGQFQSSPQPESPNYLFTSFSPVIFHLLVGIIFAIPLGGIVWAIQIDLIGKIYRLIKKIGNRQP